MKMLKKIVLGAALPAALSLTAGKALAHDSPVRHVHAGSTMAPDSTSFDAVWYQAGGATRPGRTMWVRNPRISSRRNGSSSSA
jgi:hypothetical protein